VSPLDLDSEIAQAIGLNDPRLTWTRITPDVIRQLKNSRIGTIWSATSDPDQGGLSVFEWVVLDRVLRLPERLDTFHEALEANPQSFGRRKFLGVFSGIGSLIDAFLKDECGAMCVAPWLIEKTCLCEDESISVDYSKVSC
jgi:hypothetical protein